MKNFCLKIYAALLALLPIMSGYAGIASVDLGTIILFLWGCVCALAIGNLKVVLPRGYLAFLFFSLICTTIATAKVPLGIILFVVNVILALNYTKLQYVLKVYSFAVYTACLLFLVQEVLFSTTGYRPSGLLPWIPIVYEDISDAYKLSLLIADRSSSFFLEPAYFVEFLFPFIAIKLFSINTKSRMEAIAVSFVVIFVRSGTGALLLMIIWGLWFFISSFKKRAKIFVAIVFISALAVIVTYDSSISSLYSRVQELDLERGISGESSSGFIRFYRGYLLYAELPLVNKLFGASSDMIDHLIGVNYYFSDNKNLTFLNGAQSLLIYYGFFSFVLYMRHLLLYCYKVRVEVIVLAICCIYLMLSESFFLTSRLFLCTIFICLISQQGKNELLINAVRKL